MEISDHVHYFSAIHFVCRSYLYTFWFENICKLALVTLFCMVTHRKYSVFLKTAEVSDDSRIY